VKEELKSRDKELEEYQEIVDFLKLDLRCTSAQNVEQVRHIREVEQCLKDSEEEREQLTRFFEEQLKRLEDRLDGVQKESAKIREDNSELTQAVRSLKKQLDDKHDQVQKLEASKADISARLENLERQLRNKDDGRIKDDLQRYISLTDQLQQQLLQEMDSLKRRVVFQPTPEVLKPRVVYEAIKGDEIDQSLAEYLNAKEPAVPEPSYREELGVYCFGTK
jgi:chromosome segregation ATPase